MFVFLLTLASLAFGGNERKGDEKKPNEIKCDMGFQGAGLDDPGYFIQFPILPWGLSAQTSGLAPPFFGPLGSYW